MSHRYPNVGASRTKVFHVGQQVWVRERQRSGKVVGHGGSGAVPSIYFVRFGSVGGEVAFRPEQLTAL